eukprot:3565194-Pleurochrysis_carterae.AAC.2
MREWHRAPVEGGVRSHELSVDMAVCNRSGVDQLREVKRCTGIDAWEVRAGKMEHCSGLHRRPGGEEKLYSRS